MIRNSNPEIAANIDVSTSSCRQGDPGFVSCCMSESMNLLRSSKQASLHLCSHLCHLQLLCAPLLQLEISHMMVANIRRNQDGNYSKILVVDEEYL